MSKCKTCNKVIEDSFSDKYTYCSKNCFYNRINVNKENIKINHETSRGYTAINSKYAQAKDVKELTRRMDLRKHTPKIYADQECQKN